MRDTPLSLKVYRWLQILYPAGFREGYAEPMEKEFRDELAESRGVWALVALWVRLLTDLAVSIPAQVSREMAQDARHTLRLWAGRPWHTALAIAALAIGIGANTGVFSIVNALLLRSLPFDEPSRLASLRPQEFIPPHDSAKQFHEWRAQSTYLADASLVEEFDANLGGVHSSVRAHAAQTSWNFFSTLGVKPVFGRGFLPDEDTPGRNAVVILGYGLWQQLFAGDPRAIGSPVRVDGEPLTIIGVAPPGFDYPGGAVLWKPAILSPGNNGWETIARLKSGIEWPQARAAFDAEVDRLLPDREVINNRSRRPQLRSLQDRLAGPAKSGSLVLMAGVAVILLIACANVANLLMARTADRAAELSLRSALGAGRARLTQQLFTECLLLSLVAALAGLLIAAWTILIATKVQPPPLAAQSYSILDGRVLGFAVIISILSGLLFGILPSLLVGRIHTFGTRSSSNVRGSRRIREALASTQVMLTVILLAASVSLGRAFMHLMANDRGYDVTSVVTVSVTLDGTTHQLDKRQLPYFEEALARVRRLPGVRCASATEFLPLYANAFVGGPFGLDGRRARRNSTMVPVLSGYFQTMGTQILHGREFTDAEVRSGAKVAVVNERFAAGFGAPEEVLGHQLTAGRRPPWRIVGIVKGMEYETDPSLANGNQVFIPSEAPGGFFSTFVARVDGRAEDHLAAIRDTIRSVDPQVPVFGVRTMEQRLAEVFARPKFYRTATWMFAGFALVLAVIGIYGIVSYAVAQRTHEMGVRMALGTTPVQLRSMLLWQGLVVVAAGAIPGVAGAQLTARVLESLIDGAKSIDPSTSVAVVLFLFLLASASIWVATAVLLDLTSSPPYAVSSRRQARPSRASRETNRRNQCPCWERALERGLRSEAFQTA
jgi:putative ABC transport system permease protein